MCSNGGESNEHSTDLTQMANMKGSRGPVGYFWIRYPNGIWLRGKQYLLASCYTHGLCSMNHHPTRPGWTPAWWAHEQHNIIHWTHSIVRRIVNYYILYIILTQGLSLAQGHLDTLARRSRGIELATFLVPSQPTNPVSLSRPQRSAASCVPSQRPDTSTGQRRHGDETL